MRRILSALVVVFIGGTVLAEAQQPRPTWLGKEPLIIVGNWDSMPIFRRRVGGTSLEMEQDYAKQHTEGAVRKLKELGVTMAVIHFYKGFGLKAEAPQLEDAKKLAALLKKHGLRVGVYVGSTIAFETFLVEQPQAAEWFAPDYLGRPVVYSNQSFRKRVYFMHPGYRDYIKRVLRIALEDLHADLIHFDNTSMQAQPPIFMHPLAVKDLRAYLEHKFTPEQRTVRFGFPEVQYMEPPTIDRPLGAIDDPLYQEWTDFRCEQLAAYYAEMEQFIRSLNPEAAVECNPHSGISGHNTVWEQGIDYPRLLSHMDIVWTEEGNQAQVTPDGILVSKIRTYKMASQLNNRIFTYTGGARGGKLQMAEAMAFNRQTLGHLGDVLAGYTFPADQKFYISFFRDNFDLFRDVRSRPDVAVLHSFASMGFNNDLPWQSTTLIEQAMIQARIPFDIIFDGQLKDLSKYRALVLADQECLSNEQIDLIREYVKHGGGLVSTEQTSRYDQWRRRRAATSPPPARTQTGSGRSSYIATVKPVTPKPTGAPMTSQYWKLPVNAQEIIDEIRWAANGLSLEVKGPSTLVAEPLEQPSTGRILVHLINYDDERRPSIENVQVNLRLPQGKTVREIRLVSPDMSAMNVKPALAQGSAQFTIPRIATYTIAVVDLQ